MLSKIQKPGLSNLLQNKDKQNEIERLKQEINRIKVLNEALKKRNQDLMSTHKTSKKTLTNKYSGISQNSFEEDDFGKRSKSFTPKRLG